MLITKVKVGNVTNLSEARYCAGMGVEFLTFPISVVDPKTYKEITGWVTGPKFGIEINEPNLEASQYEADFIHTSTSLVEFISVDKKMSITLIASDWLAKKSKLISLKDRILFLELIVSNAADILSTIEDASKNFEVLIKVSDNQTLEQALKLPIAGISLEGASELKPGLKEYPLADILERLEA